MAKKRFVRLGALLFIVFSCIAISNASSSTSLLADVLLYFAGFIIALLLIFHLSRRRLRKVFDDQASFKERIEATIGDNEIHYSHETGSHNLPWDRIRKWSENKRFIYLYESDLFARIIPKRAISPEEDQIIRKHTVNVRKI